VKTLGIVVGVLLVLLVAAGPFLPARAQVGRRLAIEAPPEALWPDVAALSTWPDWTEWNAENDRGYDPKPEGPALGVGSKLVWTQGQGGAGSQTITEADPLRGIRYEILVEGGRIAIKGRLIFSPQGNKTAVTWIDDVSFHGSYVGRYFAPFMDAMLGPKQARSLLSLKSRAEARVKLAQTPLGPPAQPQEIPEVPVKVEPPPPDVPGAEGVREPSEKEPPAVPPPDLTPDPPPAPPAPPAPEAPPEAPPEPAQPPPPSAPPPSPEPPAAGAPDASE
jgi:hypothetical protein